MSMSTVTVTGFLTEPEMRQVSNGKQILKITVPVDLETGPRDNRQTETHFYTATFWGETAIKLQNVMQKGRHITITGELKPSTYQKRDGTVGVNLEIIRPQFDLGRQLDSQPAQFTQPTQHAHQYQQYQQYQQQQPQQQQQQQGYPQQQFAPQQQPPQQQQLPPLGFGRSPHGQR